MERKLVTFLTCLLLLTSNISGQRHWTVAHGLPTGEVRQIVELPNGRMLVNCEGVFCLSNGHSFDVVSCNQILAYKLSQYTNRYGQLWEGDSILWLRDFYRIYRFDAHQYRFVKTDEDGSGRPFLKTVLADKADTPQPTAQQQHVIDSLHIHDATVAITDRQGGLWIGTRTNGIVYQPPHRTKPMIHTGNDPLIGQARSASLRNGQTMFVIQIDDDRQLRCDSLSHLAYAQSDHTTIPLNEKLPALNQYRHMVGACPLDEEWVAVYTQNGAFLLDTKADTLAPFPHAYEIECYSSKYNCMLKDHKGTLWVGTQNGLFKMEEVKGKGTKSEKYKTPDRIEGLTNNCIRSLVTDADGHVWTGTSYGISRITPTVVNLGVDDGIPAKPMMDYAALLLTDKRLVFAAGGGLAVSFRPDEQLGEEKPLPVVITNITINGETVESSTLSLLGNLSYKQNYLSFQFSTLNYATPSHDRYRYRIRNLESEWNTCSDGGGQCTAIYRALPPGDYTFEVQAATASSEWGTVTTFQFAIRPPWWLTWWMKTAYGLATILMIVSKYGFVDIASIPDVRLTSDGGRIAAGVIQSIGFLGAGVIFVRKESIIGLTTAAGLWATVGIGLCFGSGMYLLGISATLILVLVNILLRVHHQRIPFQTIITVSSHVSKHGMTLSEFEAQLKEAGAQLRDFSFSRNENNEIFVKANVVLSDKKTVMEHVEILAALPFIDTFEVFPS